MTEHVLIGTTGRRLDRLTVTLRSARSTAAEDVLRGDDKPQRR
jgi:hypothetical protein